MKRIQMQYYAVFREQRGLSSEEVATDAQTLGDLYIELAKQHGFSLPAKFVRASVNLEFQPLTVPLRDGDQVVFIPPVAGG